MAIHFSLKTVVNIILAVVIGSVTLQIQAEENALDLLVGRWDVEVTNLKPKKSKLTYSETYRWTLNRQFLHGETSNKSDGNKDVVYATYDRKVKGYHFWVFSSTGSFVYLPPATWNSRTRTMEWRNLPNSDISYHTLVVFPDDKTRHWTLIVKDWKGSVLQQQEGRAVRLRD